MKHADNFNAARRWLVEDHVVAEPAAQRPNSQPGMLRMRKRLANQWLRSQEIECLLSSDQESVSGIGTVLLNVLSNAVQVVVNSGPFGRGGNQ